MKKRFTNDKESESQIFERLILADAVKHMVAGGVPSWVRFVFSGQNYFSAFACSVVTCRLRVDHFSVRGRGGWHDIWGELNVWVRMMRTVVPVCVYVCAAFPDLQVGRPHHSCTTGHCSLCPFEWFVRSEILQPGAHQWLYHSYSYSST